MSIRKIVEVEWFDAQTSVEALYIDEIKEQLKPHHSRSVGYFIHENKEYIILSFCDFGEDLLKHHQIIPKSIIKEIKVIRDGVK